MNFLSSLLLIPAITGLCFLITGFLLGKYPPKKINSLYGYRTGSSMKSQERWDFAQKHSAKEMMLMGFILIIISFFGFWWEYEIIIETLAGTILILVSSLALIYRTERAIKNKFMEG